MLPAEYDAVGELTVRVYQEGGFGSPSYHPALRLAASRDASAEVLVATLDDRVVGAVTIATRGGEWAERAKPGEAEIRMLVVDPAARGAGIGQALVLACIERAREDGCTMVRLSTETGMRTAHRLYERLGFVRAPDHDWVPVPGVTLLGYELPLLPLLPLLPG